MQFSAVKTLKRPTPWRRRLTSKLKAAAGHLKKGLQNIYKLSKSEQLYFSPVGGFNDHFGFVCLAEGSNMEEGGTSFKTEFRNLLKKISAESGYLEREQACRQLTRLLRRNPIERLDKENLEAIEKLVHEVTDPLFSTLVGLLISTQNADYLKHFFSKFIPTGVKMLHDALLENRERIFERFSFEDRKMIFTHLEVTKRYYAASGIGREVWASFAHSLIHPVEFVWDVVETMIAMLAHKHNVEVKEPQTLLNLTTRALSLEEIMGSKAIRKDPLSITYGNRTFFPEFFNKVSVKPGELILIFRAQFDHDDLRNNIPEKYTTRRVGGAFYAINITGRRPQKKPLAPLLEETLKEIENHPDISSVEFREKLISKGWGKQEIIKAISELRARKYIVKGGSSERGTKIYYGEIELGIIKESELHIRFARDEISKGIILPEESFELMKDIFNFPEKYFRGDAVAVGGPGLQMVQAMGLKQIQIMSAQELLRRYLRVKADGLVEAINFHLTDTTWK